MKIFINKNGQQLGPFDENTVRQMLNNEQLSLDDYAIRQGQQQWEKLSALFPTQTPPSAWNPPVSQPLPPNQFSNQFQPTPPPSVQKSGGSKGWIFGLLGCGGLLVLGIVGATALYFLSINKNNNLAINTSSNSNKSSNSNSANNSKTPEYYKAYNDKKIEFSRLKPPVKLDKDAKLKGKITIIERTSYNFDFKMIGFDVRSNPNLQEYISNDETAIKDYGLNLTDLAENVDELETLVQIICEKGKVIGRYTGGIIAYSNRCNVNVIDYKANTIIAQKTFENKKPKEEIKSRSGQTEEVLLYPFAEIRGYIKSLPRQ